MELSNNAQAVAAKIILRARHARISIDALQANAGVGNTTIHRWKNGIVKTPDQTVYLKLMAALDEADKAYAKELEGL